LSWLKTVSICFLCEVIYYEKTALANFNNNLYLGSCRLRNGGGESKAGGDETVTFQAAILEIQDGYYLVEPVEGSAELNSADQIAIPMINMEPSPEPEVGDVLEIEYDGSIAESYPAQITKVYSIRVAE
jgi:hypothetical protein